ncbi:phosphatidylserine decarboxylase [Enterococcus saccharolyticus]|uniref:Phosphatidylserine decarboxylase n=1 Tax=Candidatus Enterococcus willemsii TaxID=1857215 RepID=A0ABQ6YVU3_9ENTE|nr:MULTISPECIES: phosphatidylserine decarboxylase [Enterococcus]KAF1301464.1 phosphatidylserine decarboxylase [Enterococcus sp. CU12B]MCD5003114.1 phosphatidylserine decarboxylase [Enterococcus saccharolyticus]
MTKIYQRQTKKISESIEYQEGWLRKLYQTKWGKKLLPLVTANIFSTVWTWKDYTPFSQKKITEFLETYQLDLTQYEKESYRTFAEFFIRKKKKYVVASAKKVLAVAEGKLLILPIQKNSEFSIKNQHYRLAELVEDAQLAQQFEGGTLCIYRLAVEDYHRYLNCETGIILKERTIRGRLHTIREIAQQQVKVFKENKRSYCVIESEVGPVLQMEIGALLVGKIHNFVADACIRGEEKGYFQLGGSTILVAYPKGAICIDADIQTYSQQGIETQVRIGEGIGVKND